MTGSTDSSTHAADADHGTHHIVPFWLLATTLAVLLILTVITVGVTKYDFGAVMNLWVAMIIATAKATLVGLYFMHLRYEKPIVAIVLIASLFFVLLFVGLALMDSVAYQGSIGALREADPSQYAPELER